MVSRLGLLLVSLYTLMMAGCDTLPVAVSTPSPVPFRVSRLIGDVMVMQRDARVPVWGWASAGQQVTVTFDGTAYATTADASGNWTIRLVWADAKIVGNQVVVWRDHVAAPVAVRYAWGNNPIDANLFNREHLPAAPFRTDRW